MSGEAIIMRSLRQRFKYYDKDGDGRLSAAEVLAMLEEEKQPEGLDAEHREAISTMLEELEQVDFDEFYGLRSMVFELGSDEEDSEDADEDYQDEEVEVVQPAPARPAARARREPEPAAPRDRGPTPPRARGPTPPRRSAGAPAAVSSQEPGQLNVPPPLPGKTRAAVSPTQRAAHSSKPRARPSADVADPPVERARLQTRVLEQQLSIASEAGFTHDGHEELSQELESRTSAHRKKGKKKSGGGGGAFGCGSKPKRAAGVMVPVVPPAMPMPEVPEESAEDELTRQPSATVAGWTAPEEAVELDHSANAMQEAESGESASSELEPAVPQMGLSPSSSRNSTPERVRGGSEEQAPHVGSAMARTTSWSRNPSAGASRDQGSIARAAVEHSEHVSAALSQAEAAKQFAEQMVEAAHQAQADAVRAAREAAAAHASAEARTAAKELVETAQETAEREMQELFARHEKELEDAKQRALDMVAVAEAVGAQRIMASAASVNRAFDEAHPELSAAHPVNGLDPSSFSEGAGEPGSPARLGRLTQVASSLPTLDDMLQLSTAAMDHSAESGLDHVVSHHGCVYVTVHEAMDLKNMEVFGKMSPFVTLTVAGVDSEGLERVEKRTATHVRGGKTPTWDEAFVFPVNYGEDEVVDLTFQVWDDENIEDKLVKRKERTVDDDYCGMAVKSLTAVIKEDLEQVEGDEKEWLDLDIGNGVYGEGKLLGQLCVSMRYKEGPLELMHA